MDFNGGLNNGWRDAFKMQAIRFEAIGGSFWYKFWWYLWSADIWFGKFPLLKFIVGVNILVWILLFWL